MLVVLVLLVVHDDDQYHAGGYDVQLIAIVAKENQIDRLVDIP